MSFLKNLFGGGDAAPMGAPKVLGEEEYRGFTIRAIEMRAGSNFQLAGTIEKRIGEEPKRHQFIRADTLSSKEDAMSAALAKGRQLVDERGDRLFSEPM